MRWPKLSLKLCALMLVLWPLWGESQSTGERVVLLEVTGVIGPAVDDYVVRNLRHAEESGATLVILRMDTPGGLDTSMRDIIHEILDSQVPVVTYVAPAGARAASAGTYILYASHVAAMAPATNLGSATPVQVATPMSPASPPQQPGDEAGETPGTGDAMKQKIINDAAAYIRGLAELRGRNAEWAEKAVREAANLTYSEALEAGVIDIVATDVSDLLAQLDGWQVSVLGRDVTLRTAGVVVERVEPDWRSQLLAIITDPNVAYILMMIGIYGLIYEFANPGMILPGVAGAICLILAMFAFQVLPINYAGLALILLGMAFMVGELFVPSFGALGIGGVIAFVIGSVILLDTNVPGMTVAWPVIGMFALTSAGFFMLVINLVFKAQHQPVVSGAEELIGSMGDVLEDFSGRQGRVRVHSELWKARGSDALRKGQRVRVVARDGLVLQVEAVDNAQQQEV